MHDLHYFIIFDRRYVCKNTRLLCKMVILYSSYAKLLENTCPLRSVLKFDDYVEYNRS